MGNAVNSEKDPIKKLCVPEEAALLWDEYKYRHDLIWKHLIRSTIAVFILITVPYSTKYLHNKFFIWSCALVALVYLAHTITIIYREHKLLEKVKVLHRKRQIYYLDLSPNDCIPCEEELRGHFLRRIVWYLTILMLLVLIAIIGNILFRKITLPALKNADISVKDLADSGITIPKLIEPGMTIEDLKPLLKKDDDRAESGKSGSFGVAKLTAAMDKFTKVIEELIQKKETEKVFANQSDIGPCTELESFLRKINPIQFESSKRQPIGNNDQSYKEIADYLKENSTVYITVEGYADNIGTADSNFELGLGRAMTIKKEICLQGVDPDRILIVSYGEQLDKGSKGSANDLFRKVSIKAARVWEGKCFPAN